MKRLLVVLCALPLLALNTGCGDDETGDGSRADTISGLTGNTATGEVKFEASCALANCHNTDGTPGGSDSPDFNTDGGNYSQASIIDVILNGQGSMAAQGGVLDDQEIADITAYMLETW